MYKKILFFVLVVLAMASCEKDFLKPAIENNRNLDDIQDEPSFALGLLYNGYTRLPTGISFIEMATDDAVSSDEDNTYSNMAIAQCRKQKGHRPRLESFHSQSGDGTNRRSSLHTLSCILILEQRIFETSPTFSTSMVDHRQYAKETKK